MRTLVAIPVYNEERHVRKVLQAVFGHAAHVLVIDDGSTDATPEIVADFPVDVIRHAVNRGYGVAMRDAFMWARGEGYDRLITMDCDEQHEPAWIPVFAAAAARPGAPDVISGSRYLEAHPAGDDLAPSDRRSINAAITEEVNDRLGLGLTDAFCGFKSYRVSALAAIEATEPGYAFPMQFWAQAAAGGLSVGELAVRRIYNNPMRTFGGPLDDPAVRLAHYRKVLHREIRRLRDRLPSAALEGLCAGCRPR